jgi:hypothetical protein
MQVHPAMFMKTKELQKFSDDLRSGDAYEIKEWENPSRPTPENIPGASAHERCGSRRGPPS